MSEQPAKRPRGRPPRPPGKRLSRRLVISLNDAEWEAFNRSCRERGWFPAAMARWAVEMFTIGLSGHPILLSFSDEDWRWLKRIAKKAQTDDMNALIMGAVQDYIELEK